MITALAALSAVLRALAFFNYRFDSDEPQHLHVAWGWTAGLLQYRDVFDNHAPLFHMLTAPILALVGERPTVLFWMRLPMLALWAVVLWATFVTARRLYDARIAAWSTLLLAMMPVFFLKSLEYRTDNLWNALWMLAVVALLSERFFTAGIFLGLAMATSMKTTLLIATLLMAAAITRTLRRGHLLLLAGAIIPPALIALYFWHRGAWPSVVYCVVKYSEEVAATWDPLAVWLRRAFWIPAMVVIIVTGARTSGPQLSRPLVGQPSSGQSPDRRSVDGGPEVRGPRFWAVATAVFFVTLIAFWILLSPRDALPFLPFLVIFTVAALRARPALLAASAVVFLVLTTYYANGFRNRTREYTTMMNQVLGLTRPGDYLMDLKGETVYRSRPYYYIFEAIGRRELERHMIPDNVPESIVAARCYVTQADGPFFSQRTQEFLRAHFLDVGRLRAAGSLIHEDGSFTIAVPGDYVVIRQAGQGVGTLDGTRYAGARRLDAGPHRFDREVPGEVVTVLWAPAFQRGYSPFHRRDREF